MTTMEKVQKVKDLQKEGVKINDALKQTHLGSATYYKLRKKVPGKKAKAAKKPRLETIALAPESKITCLIGLPSEIAAVLRGMG